MLAVLDELVDETTMAYVRGQLGEDYAPLFGAPEEERFRRDEPVLRDDFLDGITPPAR